MFKNFFKCKHPASMLRVERDHSTKKIDADFDEITYHLSCGLCYEKIDIKHAQMIGGVVAFLTRVPSGLVGSLTILFNDGSSMTYQTPEERDEALKKYPVQLVKKLRENHG